MIADLKFRAHTPDSETQSFGAVYQGLVMVSIYKVHIRRENISLGLSGPSEHIVLGHSTFNGSRVPKSCDPGI